MNNNQTTSIWSAAIAFVSSFYAYWLFESIVSDASKAGGTAPMVMYIIAVLASLFAWGIAAALFELLLRQFAPPLRGAVLALSSVAFLVLHGRVPLLVALFSLAMSAYVYFYHQRQARDQQDLKDFH